VTEINRERLLDSIAEYAARVEKADNLAQADTISKAEDLAALYDEGSWVEEWQKIKPATKDALGRVDPASRNRFAAWLVWAEDQRGKSAPQTRYTHRLLMTNDLVSVLPGHARLAPGLTEKTVRPLSWLLKAKYEDRIPQVWARAVELADGGPVTDKHVQEARREFRATLSPSQDRAAVATQRARTHRLKAQSAVEQLWADRDVAEAEAFKQWFLGFLQDKAAGEARPTT
jgi:hypothetical protein